MRAFYKVPPNDWWFQKSSSDQSTMVVAERDSRAEEIRQWLLLELIRTYNYPAHWLGARIVPFTLTEEQLLGLDLLTDSGVPFLKAVVGQPGMASQAEVALRSLLMGASYTGLGISTDGTKPGTLFLRRRFDSNKCDYLTDIEPYMPPRLKTYDLSGPWELLSERAENIFFEAHSHIRDIDGMHADEALDELCKVIYVKLFDEEQAATPQEQFHLTCVLYGSVEELAATARNKYKLASEYDQRVFGTKIPGYRRSRGVFNVPIRLSSPALAKVIETFQTYSLNRSDTDIKGRAFQKVFAPAIRSGMGQYFTPDTVVKFMVDVAQPKVTDLVLDPFCGSGRFLSASLEAVREINDISTRAYHEHYLCTFSASGEMS